MSKKIKLLFVDDEKKFLDNISDRLRLREVDVTAYESGDAAMEAIKAGAQFDVALIDLKMPGMDGEELLNQLKRRDDSIEVVILTGHGSIKSATSLTRSGAYEYLLKPCELDEIISAVSAAYAKRVKAKSDLKAKKVNEVLSKAIGYSPGELLEKLRKIDKE